MTLILAATIASGIVAPHLLPLRNASPSTAATLWICSLLLRALAGVSVVLYVVIYLPHTALFHAITHWCWHAVLPWIAGDHGLDGHQVGGAATVIPGFLVAASVASVFLGIARAACSVKRLLDRSTIGRGPQDSVIVAGPDVFVATAGLVSPRIVVSAGALTELDDQELAAGLDHERGHIARQHRHVIVVCELAAAVGRFIPGGQRALAELNFQLERDADQFALARDHDRLALASAICKAATPQPGGAALAHLGGPGVAERLRQLMDDCAQQGGRPSRIVLTATAAGFVALTLAASAAVPAGAIAGIERNAHAAPREAHCLK